MSKVPPGLPQAAANVVVVSDRGVWTLHCRDGGRVLANLVVNGGDLPWLNARVAPDEGLEDVLPLFAEELRLLDCIEENAKAWDQAYSAILATVTLRYPDGRDVPEFLLHIDGDEAWWRWSDEPFDEGS